MQMTPAYTTQMPWRHSVAAASPKLIWARQKNYLQKTKTENRASLT